MPQRPSHLGLRHLALGVRASRSDEAFLRRRCWGFEVEWEPDADNIYLSSGIDNLALHRSTARAASRPAGEGGGSALDHLGLIVRSPEDVDAWAAFLESRGVTLDATPRTHRDGARSCYFRDPDGNSIQIIHHPPISGKV